MTTLNEERRLTYKGYDIVVRTNPMGFRCGYVVLDMMHPLFGIRYDDAKMPDIAVHGGITYSEMEDRHWVLGFDCGHAGDGFDIDIMGDEYRIQWEKIGALQDIHNTPCWTCGDVIDELCWFVDRLEEIRLRYLYDDSEK